MSKVWIALRCEEEEKMIYRMAAKAKGMTLSAFIRTMLDKAALDILIDEVERDRYTGRLKEVSE